MEVNINSENFDKEVIHYEGIVIVDFYGTWCMPCKMFAPILEEAAEEYEDKLKIVKVNIDEAIDLAQKYSVISIPTLKLFKNGTVTETFVGAMTAEELEDWIDQSL